MSMGVRDWSGLTRLRLKYLKSFGSIILVPTSLPVRAIESNVSTSGANPMFPTAKSWHGLFFAFFGFRVGLIAVGFPNSTAGLPAGMITVACGPPMLTVKEQLDLLPATSVAVQVTVVTPSGKLEPDAGEQASLTPGRLSVTVGGG
jgi:hypothetical protein